MKSELVLTVDENFSEERQVLEKVAFLKPSYSSSPLFHFVTATRISWLIYMSKFLYTIYVQIFVQQIFVGLSLIDLDLVTGITFLHLKPCKPLGCSKDNPIFVKKQSFVKKW